MLHSLLVAGGPLIPQRIWCIQQLPGAAAMRLPPTGAPVHVVPATVGHRSQHLRPWTTQLSADQLHPLSARSLHVHGARTEASAVTRRPQKAVV